MIVQPPNESARASDSMFVRWLCARYKLFLRLQLRFFFLILFCIHICPSASAFARILFTMASLDRLRPLWQPAIWCCILLCLYFLLLANKRWVELRPQWLAPTWGYISLLFVCWFVRLSASKIIRNILGKFSNNNDETLDGLALNQ